MLILPPTKTTLASLARAPRSRRTRILRDLSRTLGVPLTRIVKFLGDEPRYRLETQLGSVDLGDVRGLIEQSELRKHIAACTGIYRQQSPESDGPVLLDAC